MTDRENILMRINSRNEYYGKPSNALIRVVDIATVIKVLKQEEHSIMDRYRDKIVINGWLDPFVGRMISR